MPAQAKPRSPGDARPRPVSVPPAHFDALFARHDDPWRLDGNWTERRKFGLMMAALPRERYRRCFEPGCANGDLTLLLASRCDEVAATDCAARAVDRARSRLSGQQHVRVDVAVLPGDEPAGTFDLVVLSELLYYLSAEDLAATVRLSLDHLDLGGELVLVHFRSSRRCLGYDGYNIQPAVRALVRHDPVIRLDDESFLLEIYRKDS